MKKFILLLIGIFMTIMCLAGIFSLSMLLRYADFQQGKIVVVIIFLLMIAGFGWSAFKCFKFVFRKKETTQNSKTVNYPVTEMPVQPVADTHQQHNVTHFSHVMEANAVRQDMPQRSINNMRMSYTGQQAVNDMRIIDESLAIMEKTCNIDTFLSRYDMAMRCVLTLKQAKKAGIPIALQDGFSQSLANAKGQLLASVLYRSFNKELSEIKKLKTEHGMLNRIDKYQEKLKGMYKDVFEFVAEDAYKDVLQKLDFLKNNS